MSFEWSHALNRPSVYRLILVAEAVTRADFRLHYGVRLMRNPTGEVGGWMREYDGLHLDIDEWLPAGDVDEHYWSSMGQSPDWLLTQPLLQPMASANPDWMRYDLWWDHGPADDVVKKMAAESMGGGAEADRQFSYFAIQGYAGAGAWGCYEGRYIRLLDAMVATVGEDGSRGLCDFRVVPAAGGYELQTFAPFYGTDRRRGNPTGNKPTIFSLENGNVLNPRRQVLRHAEVTVAIGGWAGGGAEQDIYQEVNAAALAESPFNRREAFYDLRDVTQPDQIAGILQQKLVEDGAREIVTFEPLQTPGCLYGRDWGLGDLCTLDLWGESYDVRITGVTGKIWGPDSGEDEVIAGQAESWTRADLVS